MSENVSAIDQPVGMMMTITRLRYAAATISWIDPRTGLKVVDPGHPKDSCTRDYLVGAKGYRFSNFLDVDVNYRHTPGETPSWSAPAFSTSSGLYADKSAFNLDSKHFDTYRWNGPVDNDYVFLQTCGARTRSPEIAAIIVGGGVGGAAAWVVRYAAPIGLRALKIVRLASAAGGPLVFASSIVVGGAVGYIVEHSGVLPTKWTGGLPPIWSMLWIRLKPNGDAQITVAYSLFPSLSVFASSDLNNFHEVLHYDGSPSLRAWFDNGWGDLRGEPAVGGPQPGNPWKENKWL